MTTAAKFALKDGTGENGDNREFVLHFLCSLLFKSVRIFQHAEANTERFVSTGAMTAA
jgi:hypothetical protein